MTDILDNELAEEENTEVPSVPAEPEPVLTFYRYDTDGFYLGTTCRQEENTTDVPFEYEPGFWFFFDNGEWRKVKIPDSVSELDFDITLDDNATNYQKTLMSVAQRLFAEYSGDEYRLVITDNHYKTVHISEEERQKEIAEQRFKDIQTAVQAVLDKKAKEKNYDNGFAVASYALSTNDTFRSDAAKFIAWRDAVWAKCYQILDAYKAGEIEMPSVENVIAVLPELEWDDE